MRFFLHFARAEMMMSEKKGIAGPEATMDNF